MTSIADTYRAISPAQFLPEEECLQQLAARMDYPQTLSDRIMKRAAAFVETIRANPEFGLDAFLQQYSLSHKEGVLIMCLAEALLRIPDAETANNLIRDKFAEAQWERHLGKSDSLLVNASTWGLVLSGGIIGLGQDESPLRLLGKLIAKSGEPVIRQAMMQAMRIMGHQFILGRTIKEGLENAQKLEKRGYRYSYDILGEGARTMEYADGYLKAYLEAITEIGASPACKNAGSMVERPGISIKLSALHPRYLLEHRDRVLSELAAKLKILLLKAKEFGIITAIDAEEVARLDLSLELFEQMVRDPDFVGYDGIGIVVQGYQKRAAHVIDWLAALAKETGKQIPIRLVKGAYWDTEVKRAQVMGLVNYPVFTQKHHTDVSYIACAQILLKHGALFYPQFATHNAHTMAAILEMAAPDAQYEFQRLHGMGESLHEQLMQEKGLAPSRIYAPIGKHEDLLPYLVRRILENGANTSFINRLANKELKTEDVLADPVAQWKNSKKGTPMRDLPLPHDLYGSERPNSAGLDLGNAATVEALYKALDTFQKETWNAAPTFVSKGSDRPTADVTNPANLSDVLGTLTSCNEADIALALEKAASITDAWDETPVAVRAAALRKAADMLEENKHEAIALCIREAGKTLFDAVNEIREAVDFCRYYAVQGETLCATQRMPGPTGEFNSLSLRGRGIFACISPWNFPLAIFVGQVTAALVTGNAVIAKPAEQTPLIAAFMVDLLHKAGIPKEALQLLPGKGSMIGKHLLSDPRIAGVAFTGSTNTAWTINRTLAARDSIIAPLIAETGGQNCMVVDSSALLEQVVDDVMLSAFYSAGQRCSALRVLFIQEDVADHFIELLKGAVKELQVGNPYAFSTDIGPVIDAGAKKVLDAHIARMEREATLICRASVEPSLDKAGTFVAPTAFEIKNITQLTEEVFGPVLHIVRFPAGALDRVIADINRTGFGLTVGVHSRIDQVTSRVASKVKAGNCYVNRSMTGAVVGVQPFGGEGLSGTGPKAGGPHYLLRFVTERTLTINTAAIGGNIELFR